MLIDLLIFSTEQSELSHDRSLCTFYLPASTGNVIYFLPANLNLCRYELFHKYTARVAIDHLYTQVIIIETTNFPVPAPLLLQG